jgi:hypothetical protein
MSWGKGGISRPRTCDSLGGRVDLVGTVVLGLVAHGHIAIGVGWRGGRLLRALGRRNDNSHLLITILGGGLLALLGILHIGISPNTVLDGFAIPLGGLARHVGCWDGVVG